MHDSQAQHWLARSRAAVWHPCTQMKRHETLPIIPIASADGIWLQDFDGKELASVAKGGLDLGQLENEAEKKQHEETETRFKELVEKMKTSLGDKAKEVRVTFRLTDSPACLVADETS